MLRRSTTPQPSAITSHRIFIRITAQGSSPLAGTLDAALNCLVALVVVTWPASSILLFFLTTRFISYQLSWTSKSPVFRSYNRTLDCYFRLSDLHPHQPIQLHLFSSFPFYNPGLSPSPCMNSVHASLLSIQVWSPSDSIISWPSHSCKISHNVEKNSYSLTVSFHEIHSVTKTRMLSIKGFKTCTTWSSSWALFFFFIP